MTVEPPPPPDDPFTELLLACEEALAAGDPSTFNHDPEVPFEMRLRLERNLDCLRLLHEVMPRARKPAAGPPGEDGGETRTLGRFELRRRLGQGAFGVVWLAHDPRLKREVALKVPHAGALADEGLRRRFVREAEAAAGLEHPNIVAVYEAGDEGPVCYIVSAYCDGPNLAQWLKQRDHPVPVRDAAGLVAALAEGVEHAHRRGVIHRDLKPANVLLADDGTPRVTDFGLAKVLAGSAAAGQTQSGAIVGTPAYMAPEQAAGKHSQIGPAADVWALGVILYELLTGRPPFQADTTLETLLLVQAEDPVVPSRVRKGVPRDLEGVCLKCLRKEPDKRYAGAAQLAGELRRFLAGLPLQYTRSITFVERAVRWCRRNPRVALLLAALGFSILGGLAFSVAFAWRAEVEAGTARTQKGLADQEAERAKQREAETRAEKERSDRSLYLASMQLAQQAWEEGAMDRLRELLERQRPERTGGIDYRGFEWHYWSRCLHSDLLTIQAGRSSTHVSCSPDGRWIVGNTDTGMKIWDADTGREVQDFPAPANDWEVAWSDDGQRLASCPRSPPEGPLVVRSGAAIKVWKIATREVFSIPMPNESNISGLAFSPDGSRLAARVFTRATPSFDGIKVWDASDGKELFSIPGERRVTFSPDGRRLACWGLTNRVRVMEAATGKLLHSFEPNGVYSGVTFSPDGQRMACALGLVRERKSEKNQGVGVWDLTTGTLLHVYPVELDVHAVAFSQDGDRLAYAGLDRTIRVCDLTTHRELVRLKGHAQPVESLAFHPDGWRLVSAGSDGAVSTIKVWDTTNSQEARPLPFEGEAFTAAFSTTGDRVAVGGLGGGARVYDAATGKEPPFRSDGAGFISSVAFSPDGATLAGAFWDRSVRFWGIGADQPRPVLRTPGLRPTTISYRPDGLRLTVLDLVQAGKAGEPPFFLAAREWDPRSGALTELVKAPVAQPFPEDHVSVDCRRMVAKSSPQRLTVWDLETGQEIRSFNAPDSWRLHKVAISDDGHLVACSSDPSPGLRVWEVATGREVFSLDGLASLVDSLAFNPDCTRLATGSQEGTIKIWDLAGSGESVLTLKGHSRSIDWLGFSPDGLRLLSVGESRAKIWDASPPSAEGNRQSAVVSAGRYHRGRIEECLRSKRWEELVIHLDYLLSEKPDVVEDLQTRGRAHAALSHWDRAAADYARVLDVLPQDRVRDSHWSRTCGEVATADELFSRVTSLRPDCDSLWVARGRWLAGAGKWGEAAQAFARVIDRAPLPTRDRPYDEVFEYPCLRLLAGEQAGYGDSCRALAERAGDTPDPMLAYMLARACGCGPRTPLETDRMVGWARQGVKAWPNDAWQIHTLGLVLMRAKAWDEARKCLETSDRRGWGGTVVNWLALAILHHHKGDADAARNWLDKAVSWLDDRKPEALPMPDWLEANVLRREAEMLLRGGQPR